jgi:hypothetical protein
VTGGTPKTTGLYYDDSYDRTLFPPGSNCTEALTAHAQANALIQVHVFVSVRLCVHGLGLVSVLACASACTALR